jgi:hypothetical protein
MGTLWQDIRQGCRQLRKTLSFTAVAVISLALGLGANTAIFTLIDALLLKPLPRVTDPQQPVLATDHGWPALSYALYEHLRNGSQSLSGLFASSWIYRHRMIVTGSGAVEAEPVQAQAVSGSFFSVLGTPAVLGRTLTPNDDRPGDPQAVAVISYDFWHRRFGQEGAVRIGCLVVLRYE